jgi:hypothetical protein
MGLGQQVDLTVTVAVLQHGDLEVADEPACGQRLQLLLEADSSSSPTRVEAQSRGGAKHR